MNPLQPFDQTRQQAPRWSARLGELAGRLPRRNPQLGRPAVRVAAPSLPAMLARVLQRSRAQEDAADTLRINEFAAG